MEGTPAAPQRPVSIFLFPLHSSNPRWEASAASEIADDALLDSLISSLLYLIRSSEKTGCMAFVEPRGSPRH